MATTFGTHGSVGSTIELLEAELPQLEEQQRALEKELAAVTGRLDAARAALSGLQLLSPAPLLQEPAVSPAAMPEEATVAGVADGTSKRRRAKAAPPAAAPASQVEPTDTAPAPATRKKATSRKTAARPAKTRGGATPAKPTAKATKAVPPKRAAAAAKSAKEAAPKKRTSGLTDSILDYLATAEGPVRAGDVTQALGREATPGSVNAVRTALERMVKASNAQRTGRGLYQALPR